MDYSIVNDGEVGLPSVRLRLKSVRLRPICQFGCDLYVKALKLNRLKVLVEPRRNTEY